MTKVLTLFACVLLAAFTHPNTAHSQYSSEAFELKKASDLYDERGYGESSSITVDGNLVVSNSSGVPSYVYPISHHTISGYPLDVSLTYAGSVSFTTFNTYLGGGAPGFNWSKFQQNRPAWILGVNGFAIQVLHNALSFHCNPFVNNDLQNQSYDMFYDDRFVWLVDGYSFCNAMTNFADLGAAQESQFIDVIRLLRSDGSVLELINPTSASGGPNNPNLFTGYYAVNEANAQGYAIVEFDDEYWPGHVQASAGLDPAADNSSSYYLRPRKVRYFPGDGLEYVFREWLMPYGSFSYNGNEGQSQWTYGLPGYTPSIFYLDELRSPAGRLTSFRRSRHYPPEIWKEILGKEDDPTFDYKDSTRGRALITEFDGHEIEYLDNGMIVNALGRTTKIEFHQVSVEGSNLERYHDDPETIGNMHLAEYGYAFSPYNGAKNPVPDIFSQRRDEAFADGGPNKSEDPKFRSYLGMVTRIIDPVGRVTRFDYGTMQREYKKYRFPRLEIDADGSEPALRLENPRLVSITEPTAKYDLCYQYRNSLIYADPADYLSCEYEGSNPLSVTVHRPGIGEEYDPFRMNDVVHSVTKTFCGETLSETGYAFTFGMDQEGGQITVNSTVDVYDYKDGVPRALQRTATDFYRSTYLDNAVPGLPRKRYTGVSHTQEASIEVAGVDIDGDPILGDVITKQDTWTDYPTDPETEFGREYVVLPTSQLVHVNDKPKSYNRFDYVFETSRDYYNGSGNLLIDRTATFGTVVKEKETALVENGQDVLIKRTSFLNIKYDPSILAFRPCGELDKFATLKNYFDTYPENKETDPEWEEAMYNPGIAVFRDGDPGFPVPPVFGLTLEEAMLVPDPPGSPSNRRYLGGKKFVYGTPEETTAGGDIEGRTELIGRVLKEQQVPEDDPNGDDAITVAEYDYLRMTGVDCRVVPFKTTNANGAVTEMSYLVNDQDPGTPAFEWPRLALLHNNDEVTTYNFSPPRFFSLQFEKPLELTSNVRKMVLSGQGGPVVPGELDLKTFNHPTYYGLTEGTLDANGWYSRFDYDMNGRIRRAILPSDYRAPDAAPFTGIEEIELLGYHGKSETKMDLVCQQNQATYSAPYSETNIFSYRGIAASWWKYPKVPESQCPCPPTGTEKENELPSVQETCNKTITFVTESKSNGLLLYTPVEDNPNTPEDETSPLLYAQSLSDAKLRLVVAESQGECVVLRITCPELELDYRRTFGPCIRFRDDGDPPTASGTRDEKGGGASVQSDPEPGCQAETEVLEETKGLVVDVPLDVSRLLDVTANTQLNFRFEVLTPNTSVEFAQTSPDSRPRLVLNGTFSNTRKDNVDYTLMAEYDDRNLRSTFTAKIDDYLHTGNTYEPDPNNPGGFNGAGVDAFAEPYRRASVKHRFGADYRILETEELLKNWDNTPVSPPSVVTFDHTGNGLTLAVTDQLGNTTETEYDAAGRASATTLPGIDVYEDLDNDASDDNPGLEVEGTVESKYFVDNDNLNNAPASSTEYDPGSFGLIDLSDQIFHRGYAEVSQSIDENGIRSAGIRDALGNVRREVFATYGGVGPSRWVKYDYDVLNRLTKVTNAEHQLSEYTYDRFGRVRYKSQQDMGVSSYAYDRMGNVRFTQTEKQADEEKLTFYQYDDLNRLTLVGEAQFLPDHPSSIESDDGKGDPEKRGAALPRLASIPNLNRPTDQLADATHYLHLDPGSGHPLTYNPTLWDNGFNPTLQAPRVIDIPFSIETACMLPGGTAYDEGSTAPPPPYMGANVTNYNPIPVTNPATLDDFENAARYPNHTRMVIQYDELPPLHGPVWSGFPSHAQWNQLMPPRPDWFDEDANPNTTEIRKVRNTKGREVAVAYRDHSGEPYHYTVSSYDPRGRVEAIVHYTENIGFDAVYYEYNSMNLITKIRTVDPFRQHTTWYGYDNNGRLDSVWTELSDVGTGLAGPAALNFPDATMPRYPAYDEPRPDRKQVDIAYSYDERGLIETKRLQADPVAPGVNITVDYTYNDRRWLRNQTAVRNGNGLFNMTLEYDQAGQILRQSSQQGGGMVQNQHYEYDDIRQLKKWIRHKNTPGMVTETYLYDNIGNRENRSNSATGAMTMSYPKNGCSPNPNDPNYCGDIVGPNQLTQTQTFNGQGMPQYVNNYTYDLNGAIATNTKLMPNGNKTETFEHTYRNLLWRYISSTVSATNNTTSDWRYRYNPRGEREQRRLYNRSPYDDYISSYPWTYYLLDGRNRQLAVWNGQQTSNPTICPGTPPPPGGGSRRFLYPSEYLTYGLGSNADVITRPAGTANGIKEFKVSDHLGSTRVAIKETGTSQNWDYEPYGDPVAGLPPRKGFIDKEVDKESDLGDFGVRKYDDEIGRFLSTDVLWEKYRAWTPYHYCRNSALIKADPSGLGDFFDESGKIGTDGLNDGKMYILTNDANIDKFKADGKIDFVKLRDEGFGAYFEAPDTDTRRSITHNIYKTITIANPNEAGGVVAVDYEIDQTDKFITGGVDAEYEATAAVTKAEEEANEQGYSVTYHVHSHPHPNLFGRLGPAQRPSAIDIETAERTRVRGIVVTLERIYFYNGDGVYATVPAQSFIVE